MIDRFLITGINGDIGQNICLILREHFKNSFIIGCDICSYSFAQKIVDKLFIVQKATDNLYLKTLKKIVDEHNISLIIPTSEAEIFVLNKHRENNNLLIPNTKSINIGLDKLLTIQFLRDNNLNHPWTKEIQEDCDLPCIYKPRKSCGSKGFVKIELTELKKLIKKTEKDGIWQELLCPSNEEYTCGVYRTKSKDIHTIIIKRELLKGFTKSGIVINDKEIDNYLRQIALALELQGSINIQLIKTKDGPKAFEINPRFSGTVRFRHLLGFTDLIWAIQEKFNAVNTIEYHIQKNKKIIYRRFDDIIL